MEPLIVRWDGNDAPNKDALNVLASRSLDSARHTLSCWRDASVDCSVVVALPHIEKAHVAKTDLDSVAVVFPLDGEDPVAFVQRTINEISPRPRDDVGSDRDAPNDAAGLLMELLKDDYGLGPRAKAVWIDALKAQSSDV
jgi:hypothetical protein